MSDEMKKLDPRVKRTRQLLQQAFFDLVREKTLDSITVQDIAARAEVNRATFYAHFEDKNALIDYTVREMYQARLDESLSGEPSLTIENLRVLILLTCEYLGEFIGHCAPVYAANQQAVMFLQVQNYLQTTIREWVRKADGANLHAGISPEMVADMTSWAIWGTVFEWAHSGRKLPAEKLADQVLALLQTGLQAYVRDGVRV